MLWVSIRYLRTTKIEAILRKLLDAVGHVHSQNILHRDISPDNILLTDDMEPILIDFGAAREDAVQEERALSEMRVVKDGYSPQEFYKAASRQLQAVRMTHTSRSSARWMATRTHS